MTTSTNPGFRGTTILSERKGDQVVVIGDGQVTLGNAIMKGSARKVRRLHQGKVITGFAGSTADAPRGEARHALWEELGTLELSSERTLADEFRDAQTAKPDIFSFGLNCDDSLCERYARV